MPPLGNISLRSDMFWQSALIAAVLDAGLIYIILRLITPDRFFRIARPLIICAGVFWGLLGISIVRYFWEGYYQYFYPGWMHGWGIILFAPSIGAVSAVLFYWIAGRFRNHPIPVFLLAAGVESLLEHLLGIQSLHIMQIPMFRGVDPLSVLVFSIPEYILYWSVILLAAFVIQWVPARLRQVTGSKPAPLT
jgi:hypothetical protein